MTWKTSKEQAKARTEAILDIFTEAESARLPNNLQLAPIVGEALRLIVERCKERGLDPSYGPASVALCASEASIAVLEAEMMLRAKRKGHTDMDEVVEIAEACSTALRRIAKDTYSGAREEMAETPLEKGKEGGAS